MICTDCKREIGSNEQYAVQDKTNAKLCVECSDKYWDVQMMDARGCSCSRGGNAITCECREGLKEELREAESLAAFANDPTAARAYAAEVRAKLVQTHNERTYPELFKRVREAGREAGLKHMNTPWVEADQRIAVAATTAVDATNQIGCGRPVTLARELRSAFLVEASKAAIAAGENKLAADREVGETEPRTEV